MGKRALLAVFLSLLVITSYNYYIAQKYPQLSSQQQPNGAVLDELKTGNPGQVKFELETNSQLSPAKQQISPGKDIIVETDLVKLILTSTGGRIKSCQLKGFPAEKLKADKIQQRLNEIVVALSAASREAAEVLLREQAKLQVLLARLSTQPEMVELVSLGAMADANFSPTLLLPVAEQVDLNNQNYRSNQDVLRLDQDNPEGQIEFLFQDRGGRQVKKIYTFHNSNYSIQLELKFSNWVMPDNDSSYFLLGYGPDIGMPQAEQGRRSYAYEGPVSCFQGAKQNWLLTEKYSRQEKNVLVQRRHQQSEAILWAGLENKYFLSAIIPGAKSAAVLVEKNKFEEQTIALEVPWQGNTAYNFTLYLGPKKETQLKAVDTTLSKAIDYGFFGPIAKLIYKALVFFSQWTHNFGWAIILLCLVTKIVFYPLTHSSFESMQKMQKEMKAIQPEMEIVRQKFKDNPQKLNKEIMELYRKKGVNPLASCQSGCLPLILQMPVFFALYAVLYNSIELRGTPFLGWISDLSAKDPYYILPVLMGVSMFAQQKLTGMDATGGMQGDQAKMMTWLMPIMLTWVFSSLPAGVVLYWFTFNVLTALQQLLIKKKQVNG